MKEETPDSKKAGALAYARKNATSIEAVRSTTTRTKLEIAYEIRVSLRNAGDACLWLARVPFGERESNRAGGSAFVEVAREQDEICTAIALMMPGMEAHAVEPEPPEAYGCDDVGEIAKELEGIVSRLDSLDLRYGLGPHASLSFDKALLCIRWAGLEFAAAGLHQAALAAPRRAL